MLTIEEAKEVLAAQADRISEQETISLAEALGRTLAEDITADRDQPPFPRSPLDGYALRGEDLTSAAEEHPVTLKVVGKIYAGSVFEGTVGEGEAVRLMTGAPIPEGANAVIRQEDTDLGEDTVKIYASVKPYQNYCEQGEDYKAGTVLVKAGTICTAGVLTVIASLGRDQVSVLRQPRVSVLSTGDEVIAPGEPWQPGKIYDSNRTYITSRLRELGSPAHVSRHISDDAAVVAAEIRSLAKESDLIITTGGVSVGEKDIMHDVVKLLNARQLFWKVRIKPGSPTLAFAYEDTLVLCLSGNPFGAIANFELLGRAVLHKLTGRSKWEMQTEDAILQDDFRKPAGARRFLRGFAEDGKVYIDGKEQASGAISAMAECNCMIEITPDMPGASRGDTVKIYRF